jgi:Ca2+-binding RTX toxin-like protein
MRRGITVIAAASLVAMLAVAGIALAKPIKGTQGDDALTGTEAAEKINGKKGDDTISGLAGDDDLRGNKDDDILSGDEGNDRLRGAAGADSLDGGTENDDLDGGKGIDEVSGGDGDDTIKSRGDGNKADNITCGLGTDSVKADRNDVVDEDCENVDTTGKPPKPSDEDPISV